MKGPGLIVAPLTPFDSELKIDEARLLRQIDYVVTDCRATMVVAAGVETQEYAYLTLDERKGLIQRTLEFVGGRVPVMVGISHPALRIASELAHSAARFAAAAVRSLAPPGHFAVPPARAALTAEFNATRPE